MNPAPVSRSEIYDWLRKEIVSGAERAFPKIDFSSLDMLETLHADEVNKFKKGIGKLYPIKSAACNAKLAEIIENS